MKYLKYGFYSVVTKPLFNILIMLELAAILVVGNLAISVVNSRSVLYSPYADIINREGFIYKPQVSDYDYDYKVKNLLDSLEGDITVKQNYSSSVINDEGAFPNGYNDDKTGIRNVYTVDDDILSKCRLPLKEGRWPSVPKNDKGQIEAVCILEKEEEKFHVGDVIKVSASVADADLTREEAIAGSSKIHNEYIGEIVIVGTIGYDTYYPNTGVNGGENPDIRSAYGVVSKQAAGDADFIVYQSADERLNDIRNVFGTSFFIYYNTPPTDEIRQANLEKLSAGSGRDDKLIKMSDFKENSDKYLYEQYIKLLPILLCVFVIVLAELICSVAMNTRAQMRSYGIYFLCGCRWRDCLRISVAYSAIILVGGAFLGTIGFMLFQLTEYAAAFEQNIAVNNLYITLAIFAAMLIISLVIPFFQVHGTSPVETIKEN